MQYNKITPDLLARLVAIAGENSVITDRERMHDFAGDEFPLEDIRHFPDVVVKPADTMQVCEIVKLASQNNVPVTVRGGGTGLCGGCVPAFGGIVLSFEKMKRVIEVDTANLMAVVEPGCSLADFYKSLEGTGLFFPPHPGDENATIGGVIATNAGGARAVKYGVIRNFVRGLEVVLADGTAVNISGKLMKNSSGYSLMNLIIGSEGTLGIVTKAIIGLSPMPGATATLVVPFTDLDKAIKAVPEIIRNRILPLAVEFVESDSVSAAEDHLGKTWPCHEGKADLMIILDGQNMDEVLATSENVGEVCLENGAIDVFIADTAEKQRAILEIRSAMYEALRSHMVEILDVTVPRADIAEYVNQVHAIEKELGLWLPTFGHAADGNVHTNIMKAEWKDGAWKETAGWEKKYESAREKIHATGKRLGGIVSGEHGIGLVKKEYLPSFLGQTQIELMKGIKRVFDPKNILNPGKIFDL
jgi:glycolate oxidase